MAQNLIISIYLRIILCGASAIGLGYGVYGPLLFDRSGAAFQIVPMGAIGGLFAATMERMPLRWFLFMAALALCAIILLADSRSPVLMFRDYIYLYGVATAIKAGLSVNRYLARFRFGKFLAWGPIFCVIQGLMFLMLAGALRQMPRAETFFFTAGVGFFLGLGIGFGEEISAWLMDRRATRS